MRRIYGSVIAATFAFVSLGMCFASQAAAQCGSFVSSNVETVQPQLWDGQPQFTDASFTQQGAKATTSWDSGRRSLFPRAVPAYPMAR
jgi:hypothetical protein